MLLSNAASRLAAGGTFVATVPDANVLVRRLRASVNLSFGNSLYSVAFDDAHASKRFDPAARVFGIAYRFTLKEAVEDCVEYLVHLPTLERLAAEAGLEMLYARNFTDFFADECAANTELLERMKVLPPDEGGRLTEEEWEVAHTYTCVAFRKKPTATDALAQPVKNAGHRKLDPQEIIVLGAGASGSSAAGSSSAGGGKRARETTEQQWGESDEHGDEKKVKLAVKRESSESG
jgi:mRNA (guanine-N7-)-methyltransferase